jgi:hypothetical protein
MHEKYENIVVRIFPPVLLTGVGASKMSFLSDERLKSYSPKTCFLSHFGQHKIIGQLF